VTTKFATIADALQALPVGVENIAAHLAALGIKGTCGEPTQCALAEYLTANLDVPEHHVVRVNGGSARFASPHHPRALMQRTWFGPYAGPGEVALDRSDIRQFIDAFDGEKFPELINPDGNSWYATAGSQAAA
jgi:hypothetical protein